MNSIICFCIFSLLISAFAGNVIAESADLPDFEVSEPIIYATVEAGQSTSLSFTLLNRGATQSFLLKSVSQSPFFSLGSSPFSLSEGGSRSISVAIGSASLSPGVYVGAIRVEGKSDEIDIPVILEVQSSVLLFDASIRELPSYSELLPGTTFSPQVVVYNLRSLEPRALLQASVYALDGTRVASVSQSIEARNTLELALSLSLPEDISDGHYVLALDIIAGDSHATATTSLGVSSVALSPAGSASNKLFYYALWLIGLLLGAFILINYLWRRHMLASTRYWDKQIHKARSGGDAQKAYRKLVYQRKLLEEAHSRGYIAKATYSKTLSHIKSLELSLKKRL